MTALPQIQPPEVVEGMPFDVYLARPELSSTLLRELLVSALAFDFRRRNPRKEKKPFRVGRASHTAILEPDQFLLDYALWPKKNGRRGTNKFKAFAEAHEGRTILDQADYQLALRLRDAVRNHPIAGAYFREQGRTELSVFWTHPRTGLRLKARFDWLASILGDIKTTRDPRPPKFASDAAKYGYHFQAAMYGDGCAAAGLGTPPIKLFAVQNVEPHDVVVFNVPEPTQDAGRQQLEAALDLYSRCTESKLWPGIAHDQEHDLLLPAWAMPESEEVTFGEERLA